MRAVAAALLLAACAPSAPERGSPVSPAVARAVFDARSDAAEPYEVDAFFPSADGSASEARTPTFLLVPGGFVPREDYHWLAIALAERGYLVLVPEQPRGLAFLDQGRVDATRQLWLDGPGLLGKLHGGSIAVGGHSLGGVVAAGAASRARYEALVLLAAYPAGGDAVERLHLPSLSVAGGHDCDAALADVRAGFQRLPAPAVFATIAGLTHYGFTSDLSSDDDCQPTLPLDVGHARVAAVVGAFLDEALRGAHGALDALRDADGIGLEVKR